MSWTEINQERGMPFGGMPYDEILYKLEETDPELVADVRGDDPFFDIEDDYDQYARAEIIDRAPDDTFLESDHTRRDPALSRTVLNLRHAGGRGPNDYRLPQHPELFLGFTGNDPRGVDNQPRLDKLRAQTVARAREREVRMGHNVGHGDFVEADRPWGGAAMEYDKKEVQRRMKGYLHWFPAQKVGRPWGRNTVADEFYGLRQRHEVVGDGDEGLYVPEQDQPHSSAGWPQHGGYDPVRGAEGDAPRRVDRAADADTAPWRNTTGDADLAVARYTASTRGGRETFGPNASGGARAAATQADGDFGVHARGAAANRRVLAEGMSAAAAHRRALTRQQGGDADHGRSVQAQRVGKSAPELARDIALAARQGHHDQAMRAAGQVQDHEGGMLGPGAGLGAPPGDRQAALHSVQQSHAGPANARLANAGAMVRGLREGTSAEFRMVQGQAVAAGKMGTATGEIDMMAVGGGLAPSADYGAALRQGEAPLARAAAAADLEVHHYGQRTHANLQNPMDVVHSAQAGGFASARAGMMGRREGRTKAPEFRSHTQDPTLLGTDADRAFGSIGEYAGPHTSAVSIGDKNLRASVLADGGDDVMGHHGFDDFGEMGASSMGGDLFSGSMIGVRA
jgi:hypothetical protein